MSSVGYRRAVERDRKLVVYSWVKGLKHEYTAGLIGFDDWRDVMTPQIERILARPGVEVWVAYCPTDTEHVADLYGWIAVERGRDLPLIHYCFVKRHHRRNGFARGLLRAAGVDPSMPFLYTCQTMAARALHKAGKIPRGRWNPSIARRETNRGPRRPWPTQHESRSRSSA